MSTNFHSLLPCFSPYFSLQRLWKPMQKSFRSRLICDKLSATQIVYFKQCSNWIQWLQTTQNWLYSIENSKLASCDRFKVTSSKIGWLVSHLFSHTGMYTHSQRVWDHVYKWYEHLNMAKSAFIMDWFVVCGVRNITTFQRSWTPPMHKTIIIAFRLSAYLAGCWWVFAYFAVSCAANSLKNPNVSNHI